MEDEEEAVARAIFAYGQFGLDDRAWAILMANRKAGATRHPNERSLSELDKAFMLAREVLETLARRAALSHTSTKDTTNA